MIIIRVYVSHSIRGPKGKDATKKDMAANCERILDIVKYLRSTFPDIDFYVPAEHEDFVGKAYEKKYMTEKQILDVDCSIIDECDAIIIYLPPDDDVLQGGRLVEYNHTRRTEKPAYCFRCFADVIECLRGVIK